MSLFELPTVEKVRTESRLNPAQVDVKFSGADFDDDIATRIADEADVVDNKLQGRFIAAQMTNLSANVLKLGKEAILLRTLASLYHAAGQLKAPYKEEALDYERRAGELIKDIIAAISLTLGEAPQGERPAVVSSQVVQRVDGYSLCLGGQSEYAACDCYRRRRGL